MVVTEGSVVSDVFDADSDSRSDTVLNLDSAQARELTRQIRVALEHSYTLIIAAYRGRAWLSMGYSSWDAYCQGEFGSLALQPPREERQAVVLSMHEAGMTTRAIGSALNVSHMTAQRDIQGASAEEFELAPVVTNVTAEMPEQPQRLIGTDGKSYPAPVPVKDPKPATPSWADVPLSDELLAMSPSEMGIAALKPSSLASRPGRDRKAAAKRMTGSMDSPLPMVIRLAGEITLDQTELTVEDETDALTLTELAGDASRGVLALSHVLTAIDVDVLTGNDDSLALTALITDAVDELGRFLDAMHSRK